MLRNTLLRTTLLCASLMFSTVQTQADVQTGLEQTFQQGVAAQQEGRLDKAVSLFAQAVHMQPSWPYSRYYLANAQLGLGRVEEAIASYEAFISLEPSVVEARINLGAALQNVGRIDEAVVHYSAGLRLPGPAFPEAYNNLGVAYQDIGRPDDAVGSFKAALHLRPKDFPEAHFNLARSFEELKQPSTALPHLEAAVKIRPGYTDAACSRFRLRGTHCLWGRYAPDLHHLESIASEASLLADGTGSSVRPCPQAWDTLAYPMRASITLQLARAHVRHTLRFQQLEPTRRFRPSSPRSRLSVGYMSSDFGPHAVGAVVRSIFGMHSKQRWRVVAFDTSAGGSNQWRREIQDSVEEFVSIGVEQSGAAGAGTVLNQAVDVLVDLNGHSKGGRAEILAHQPAPVRALFLGYAGSYGAPALVQYITGDSACTPPSAASLFVEKVVGMPFSYHCNGHKENYKHVALGSGGMMRTPQRMARKHHIPQGRLLLGCFNQLYKITPQVYGVWMAMLRRIPSSTLWLLRFPSHGEPSLQVQAASHGVSVASQLHFSSLFPLEEHLQVKSLADLFLDTSPFNAHSSAVDALWAKVPILTRPWETMASRVALSTIAAAMLDTDGSVSTWKEFEDWPMGKGVR